MGLTIEDRGANNIVDIDPRDQHDQAGRVYINGNNNYIKIGLGCVSDRDMHVVLESDCKLDVGDNVRLSLANIYLGPRCGLTVGHRSGFTGLVHLTAVEGQSIVIGTDCSIAAGVSMMTSDFHSLLDGDTGARINPARSIRVGNHVWIANHANLLKGVTVGDDAVIGAHAVVTRAVPARAVAAGNPARIVRENVSWRYDLI